MEAYKNTPARMGVPAHAEPVPLRAPSLWLRQISSVSDKRMEQTAKEYASSRAGYACRDYLADIPARKGYLLA